MRIRGGRVFPRYLVSSLEGVTTRSHRVVALRVTMSAPILSAVALDKSYHSGSVGLDVLRDCSFALAKNERVAIVGQSGVGKSTLLHLLAGLDHADSGSIHFGDRDVHAMGETELAQELNTKKMDDGPFRFPAFWPADVDWAPDHNWGGCGMIGLQEMVMQTHGLPGESGPASPESPAAANRIRILPAWPAAWDVDFKLHAPYNTTVEGKLRDGEVVDLVVEPEFRRKDIVVAYDCEGIER